jgi:glycosyltransferase involved in cell wall biosynthesis
MRILQVHNRYRSGSPSGEDRVVDQEGAALLARGHVVERFERANDEIDSWNAPKKALLAARVLWADDARRALAETLRRTRADVVHIHNTFPLLSPSVLLACRAARVPAVLTVHNFRMICPSGELFRGDAVCQDCVGRLPLPAVRHGCYHQSRLESLPVAAAHMAHRRVWRRLPSAYIFISDAQRRLFSSLDLPDERVFVKSNLIPAPEPAMSTKRHVVLFAGRLVANKGIDVLLAAWDRYTEVNPTGGLGLVIAGSGPLAGHVAAWAASRPSVEVTGLVSRRECATLMASARAVVVPSTCEECFGLVAIEAMAAGVPSVASARGSLPELITDGVDGVLFEAGNASALAKVLGDVDSCPERYTAYGRAARRTYELRFDPELNIDQLLGIYRFATHHSVVDTGSAAPLSS